MAFGESILLICCGGAPFGVVVKTSESGWWLLDLSVNSSTGTLTTRASPGAMAFRIVRGVLPRNLPGVLKASAKLLI